MSDVVVDSLSESLANTAIANDPFKQDNQEMLEGSSSAEDSASYHLRPREGVASAIKPHNPAIEEKDDEEKEKVYVCVHMKTGSDFVTKSGKRYLQLWRPVPMLRTLKYFPTMSGAETYAVREAKEIICKGSREERMKSIQFAVCGPFNSHAEGHAVMAQHVRWDNRPSLSNPQKMSSPKEMGKKAIKERPPLPMKTQVIVSTRAYNEETFEPQVSYVAKGGLESNDFASRFPGGKIPFDAIMDSMTSGAGAMAKRLHEENGESFTPAQIEAAAGDMVKLLNDQQVLASAAPQL